MIYVIFLLLFLKNMIVKDLTSSPAFKLAGSVGMTLKQKALSSVALLDVYNVAPALWPA